jgi:hypothetical protein
MSLGLPIRSLKLVGVFVTTAGVVVADAASVLAFDTF